MLVALGVLGILILYALWEILRTLQRIEAFQRHVEDKRDRRAQRRDRREELRAGAECARQLRELDYPPSTIPPDKQGSKFLRDLEAKTKGGEQ